MAIASIAVFEGPSPSHEEVLAFAGRALPLVPRYRHKLRTVPFRLGRPVWVDDPDFDLRYHVRLTALPPPGGDEQLAELMGRVMSQRLDRDHPLWEYWLIEGLAQDRWALISKLHHCMVNGVSATDLYRVIFDAPPNLRRLPPTTAGLPARSLPGSSWPPRRRWTWSCSRSGKSSALRGAVADPRRCPPAGNRHRAGDREAGPVAGHGVFAERAHRPAAALHLGPGLTR